MRILWVFWAMPLVHALRRALVVVDMTVEQVQWLGCMLLQNNQIDHGSGMPGVFQNSKE